METFLIFIGRLFFVFIFFVSPLKAENKAPLNVLLSASQISLNPTKPQDISSLFVSRQINCQLFRAHSGEIALEAASSLKYLNPETIVISINRNAQFTDNTPITSDDVIATFNYLKNSNNVFRNVFSWMKSIKKIDETTLKIKLTHPVSNFLNVIASTNYAIYKEDSLRQSKQNAWEKPIGCGGYKIIERNEQFILLDPMNKNSHPIKFYFNQQENYTDKQLNQYDLIYWRFPIDKKKLQHFRVINLFDPIQMYIGLNVTKKPWDNKSARCSFLSKIDKDSIIKGYHGSAIATNNLFPKGVVGYDDASNFMKEANKYKNFALPIQQKFCLAFSRSAVPPSLQKYYENSIKQLYKNVDTMQINNFQQATKLFQQNNCDAIVLGFKSNYFDGYEFLVPYSKSSINFSGYLDDKINKQIEQGQNIDNPIKRSIQYQKIEQALSNRCIVAPLLTVPMMSVYIKDNLESPEIGQEAINEYFLGKIK